MAETLFYLFKEARPRQWIKNLAVFTTVLFTGQLFAPTLFESSVKAFFVFCFLASATYYFNDLVDFDKDQLHPYKKKRPIASGRISRKLAIIVLIILAVLGLGLAKSINNSFFVISIAYVFLQLAYSSVLKNLVILDIMTIAIGYMLRIYAGEFATGYHISVWLSLCVISLSLFLAIGKRRAELTLLMSLKSEKLAATRQTLVHYSEKLLDQYTSMFAFSTWFTYILYTFFEKPIRLVFNPRVTILSTQFLPELAERKWLMSTIPLVLYGIMRYMQLIYEKAQGESPEKILTSDIPLFATVVMWISAVFMIIYFL
jgi:decaprenyl-phosphate phosphoribosyltransferase